MKKTWADTGTGGTILAFSVRWVGYFFHCHPRSALSLEFVEPPNQTRVPLDTSTLWKSERQRSLHFDLACSRSVARSVNSRGAMGDSAYSFSLTTFSRTGKLLQIEYALMAVQQGKTSLGIKGEPAGVGQRN